MTLAHAMQNPGMTPCGVFSGIRYTYYLEETTESIRGMTKEGLLSPGMVNRHYSCQGDALIFKYSITEEGALALARWAEEFLTANVRG